MIFSIIANPDKYSVRSPLEQTLAWCAAHGHTVHLSKRLVDVIELDCRNGIDVFDQEGDSIKKADTIIAIGGDGTLLHTAQLLLGRPVPILGINTGKLGFMANVQPSEIEQALECIAARQFRLDKRAFLQARAIESEQSVYALNEFLFSRKGTSSLITVKAEYDGELLNRFWADGLLVSTPTGSTAYNLSAGGPIVMPGTDVMVVTPINPHTLTTRPLVLPIDKELKITVEENPENILFSFDGRTLEKPGATFSITRSTQFIELVQLPKQTYFKTLRDKLMWGQDNRENNL
ncbi:MAG: NAD(+)/NADH kinase [Balneolaceae bacterium]